MGSSPRGALHRQASTLPLSSRTLERSLRPRNGTGPHEAARIVQVHEEGQSPLCRNGPIGIE